jgi:restriction endonuclease S subunit
MEAFKISVPSIEEQSKIVREIESHLSVTDKLEEQLTTACNKQKQ